MEETPPRLFMNRLQLLKQAKERVAVSTPVEEPKAEKPQGFLARRRAVLEAGGAKYANHADIDRIVNIPIVEDMNADELEKFNRDHLLAGAYNSGFRFFNPQANGLKAFIETDGLFGPIGVGWGKTLLMLAIADIAFKKGHRKMLQIVPPNLIAQLTQIDIKEARTRIPIGYPIHVLGGRPAKARKQIAKSNKKGLYIMSYSQLSVKDTSDLLGWIDPTYLGLDEAHRVSNPTAARTKRINRVIEDKGRDLAMVAVSGTVTQKGVGDYHHLIRSTTRQGCPLPLTRTLALEWGAIIDAEQVQWKNAPTGKERNTGPGALVPLIEWAREHFPDETFGDATEDFRRAYRLRLTTSPGVVASGEADIGTSLIFENKEVPNYKSCEGWESLKDLIDQVDEAWLTPNHDQIEHAFHMWKWLYELSAGFYNELVWPSVRQYAERKRITMEESKDILIRAIQHHEVGQEYAKALRQWLERHARPKLDTPLLVGQSMFQHQSKYVGKDLYGMWREWKDLDFEGRPDRDSRAVRVCPYKINEAVRWAQEDIAGHGGIIWYHHQEIGRWLFEVARDAGLDCLLCPAGPEGNERVRDERNKDKILIASITAHGEGKNLQHFEYQTFVQWPRSAKVAEQVLGRLHRNGQKADELYVRMMNTLEFDKINFAACLNDALYIHQSTGTRQKLVYGDYDPLPVIFPSAVLREKGMEGVRDLTKEQVALRQERFGQ